MAVISPTGSTMTIAGVLARRGVTVDEGELAQALDAGLGRYLTASGTAALSDAERQLLRAGGLDVDASADERRDYAHAATRTAADYASLMATSLTVSQVAARLGVDDSRVRHRIGSGELWALHGPSRRRMLPLAQFGPDGAVVPGLAEVRRALPGDLHPLEVQGFLTSPRPELRLRARDLSPVEWLARGGAVDAVTELAAGVRDRLL